METVIWCSEKAAGLARACRREKDLFQLLVEVRARMENDFYYNLNIIILFTMSIAVNFFIFLKEKTGDEKNAAFSQDFKTLADVLIQETVRHDLGKHYPELMEHIHVIF